MLAALCEALVLYKAVSLLYRTQGGKEKTSSDKHSSIWRELCITKTIVVIRLLEILDYSSLSRKLMMLSNVCKDSKRKRIPLLCFFSSA